MSEFIAGVEVPGTSAVAEATRLLQETTSPLIYHHSRRVYFFSRLHAHRLGVEPDPELLYLVAMFHDAGLLTPFSDVEQRFEVDGADHGRKFLLERGGAAGTEIADNYEKILAELGIPKYVPDVAKANTANGYPFVVREGRTGITVGLEAGAKVEVSLIGAKVNDPQAKDLNAYLNSLPAPAGDKTNRAAIAAGRNVFRQQCTSCHNDDQSKFVPQNVVAFNSSVELFSSAPARQGLFPGYVGALGPNGGTRPGLAPVRNAPGTFDDKLIIVEASNRGQPRGSALPLLMDLKRKPKFLHDDSVASLDSLLNPTRTALAPHPFFVADATERANVVEFLNSLDDQPLGD